MCVLSVHFIVFNPPSNPQLTSKPPKTKKHTCKKINTQLLPPWQTATKSNRNDNKSLTKIVLFQPWHTRDSPLTAFSGAFVRHPIKMHRRSLFAQVASGIVKQHALSILPSLSTDQGNESMTRSGLTHDFQQWCAGGVFESLFQRHQ